MNEVIRVENLGKLYRLGEVGTGTLSKDINRWWAKARGKDDPYSRIGQVNDRTQKGSGSDIVWALHDINFSVQQGEVVGIIGRNGAGKSTLLKIISRITTPSSGNVKIRGRVASLLEVGTGFHPEMTGRENIFMNGTLLGMTRKEIQAKLDDIVDFAGVSLYVDTPVKRYSSGMQVRLAFAVAAFLEPEILIVDEVLAVGDAEFQKRAIGRIQEVSHFGGRTVLFVSHNMDAVKSICSRVLLVDKGRITNDGPTDDVIDLYLKGQSVFREITASQFKVDSFRMWLSTPGSHVETSQIPFGMDFILEFRLVLNDFNIDDKLFFAFSIRNKFGQKVSTLDNLYSENPLFIRGAKQIKVTCLVSSNFLIPAEYYVELWCGNLFETYVNDQTVGKFEIIFSNYFGNGKLYNEKQHGNVYLPNRWKFDHF